MQSTPLLLRQLLRSSFGGAKSTIIPKASRPQKFSAPRRFQQPLCLRCQFKAQIRFYSDGKSSKKPENDQRTLGSDVPTRENIISTQKEENAPHPTLEKPRDPPRDELPSQEESRRSHLSKRFSHIMDNLQTNVFIAGQRLNDLTGYSGIEALKKEIEEQGGFPKTVFSTSNSNLIVSYRGRPEERPFRPASDQRVLRSSHIPTILLATGSQRAPPAQTRLDAHRPRALHQPLPL
jgi:hypothetical protein